jgi:hypothetical protein
MALRPGVVRVFFDQYMKNVIGASTIFVAHPKQICVVTVLSAKSVFRLFSIYPCHHRWCQSRIATAGTRMTPITQKQHG